MIEHLSRLSDDKQLNILSVNKNLHASTVHLANDATKSTVYRFLKSGKYNPYKALLVQELLEDDYDLRWIKIIGFNSIIIFSDEVTLLTDTIIISGHTKTHIGYLKRILIIKKK